MFKSSIRPFMFSYFKYLFLLLCILCASLVYTQISEVYNDETYSKYAFFFYSGLYVLHTAIKPFNTQEIFSIANIDSNLIIRGRNKVINNFLNKDLLKINSNDLSISANPIVNLTTLYSTDSGETLFQNSYGFTFAGNYKLKHTFSLSYFYSNFQFPDYTSQRIDTTYVISYYGTFKRKDNNIYAYDELSFFWSVNTGKYFNTKIGVGKNFWGDGYRSLLLSDNSKNYPFVQLNLKIWKIKYVVLYSFLKDINYPDPFYRLEKKYTTSHLLSWNIAPWLNIGLFESVIWNGGETSGNRGFEINYLNPVIFFRPVEFSLNDPSPDNVLMGLFYRIKLSSKFINYGQIVLDDFNFTEFRKRIGYWGNKYGIQTGFWLFNIFNANNLSAQAEFNLVSPFTYSHITSLNNYGHYYQPLAHPLGSNFIELFNRIQYFRGRLGFISKIIFAKTGSDENDNNVGQNIYRPYGDRKSDYEYKLLNGNQNTYQIIDLKCSYLVNPEWNLKLELGFIYRMREVNSEKNKSSFITFGIKTLVGTEEYYY